MIWNAAIALLRPRRDTRSAAEVEVEVRAEIEHHLACTERELAARGAAPENARAAALKRFGNVHATREACLRIQMGDRIMLQRIHFVVTLLLLVVVLVVAWTSRQSAVAAARATEVALALRAEAEARAATAREPVEHVRVEVGDRLQFVDEYNPDEVHGIVTVAQDGKALLPEAGWIFVAGMTREQVEQEFTRLLKSYFVQSQVRVTVKKADDFHTVMFESF